MKPIAKRQFTVMSVAFMCLGLLLWARFILVTGHPRTATASPPQEPAPITRTVVVVPPRSPAPAHEGAPVPAPARRATPAVGAPPHSARPAADEPR